MVLDKLSFWVKIRDLYQHVTRVFKIFHEYGAQLQFAAKFKSHASPILTTIFGFN